MASPALPAEASRDLTAAVYELLRKPSYLGTLGLDLPVPPRLGLRVRPESRLAFDRVAETGSWMVDWDSDRGTPIMLHGGASAPYPGNAEAAARAFLRDYAEMFNLDLVPDGALRASAGPSSRGGERVNFRQYHRGIPVHDGVIVVLVDADNRVRMVSGGFLPIPESTPDMRLSADEAIRGVMRHLEPGAEMAREIAPVAPLNGIPDDQALRYGRNDLLPVGLLEIGEVRASWLPAADGWHLVWVTDVSPGNTPRSFRVFVDGITGEPLYTEMLSNETHETIKVYKSNPDSSDLTDEDIRDLDKPLTGGPLDAAFTRVLNDQAAVIADAPYSHTTDPDDPTVDLNFDEQNVFYHSNRIRQFFVDLNGGSGNFGSIDIDSDKLDSIVHMVDMGDPDADNAFYDPMTDRTLFGHGSFHLGEAPNRFRSFALEESIVYHEFSHRINDNVAGFGGQYGGATNEAFADYWAATLTNDKYFGEFANPDPEEGDDSGYLGVNGFFRSMENDRVYSQICDNPFDPVTVFGCIGSAQIHSDGEILGATLWDLRRALMEAIGPTAGIADTDALMLEALFNMAPATSDDDDFIEARDAILTADSTLFGARLECLIWSVFAAREMGFGATNLMPPTVSTALPAACAGASTMSFSTQAFTCAGPDSGTITIEDPDGGAVATVTVTSDSGDSETFALSWNGTTATTSAFDVDVAPPIPGNGVVEVTLENEAILAAYVDDSPVKIVNAYATVDCSPSIGYVSSRTFNGSCDADDPFLDAGESALLGVTLENTEAVAALSGVQLTLVSGCGDVVVGGPATRTLPDLEPGERAELIWAVQGDPAATPGTICNHTITVSGPGLSGAESPIELSQQLENDLNYVQESLLFDFVSDDGGFGHATAGGNDTWHYQTDPCANPPDFGYWKVGPDNCGPQSYSINEASQLSSPWVRFQPAGAKYPSRLTNLRYQHQVDFGVQAAAAPLARGDRPGESSLQLLNVAYDSNSNTEPDFVLEDIDLLTSLPPINVSHGWVQFLWFFFGNNTGAGGFVNGRGWYIDSVEIVWESPVEVADANAVGVCAPSVALTADDIAIADPSPAQGNGEGIVDPGEVLTLIPTLSNSGTGTAESITGTLTTDRPDIITIVAGVRTFPNILALEGATSDAPHFTFAVDPTAVCGDAANFTLTIDRNGAVGTEILDFGIEIGQLTPTTLLFSDDFETDSGMWTVNASGTDTATAGQWERVNPVRWCYDQDCLNNNETQPGDDFDPGTSVGSCFVTESGDGDATYNLNDVDGGPTTFASSDFNLSGATNPIVSYARHLYNRDGDTLDAFLVEVSDDGGSSWTTLESVSDANGTLLGPVTNFWSEQSFLLSSFIASPTSSTMRFRFTAQDQAPGQIVEAAVDAFRIRDTTSICNVFAPPLPLEVSPPGAGIPFTVERSSTEVDQLDLTWEPTTGATSYRIISGDLVSLQPGGVTAANASPLECTIGATTHSFVEPAGSVFLIVQGDSAAGLGPLGDATSAVPRASTTLCP